MSEIAMDNLTPDEFLEQEAGSRFHRAVNLVELQNACEAAHEEFRYDPDAPQDVLAALALLKDYDFRV